MKREFLKGLGIEGLTDEVIESIMKENGKDITREQQAVEKVKTELENSKIEIKAKDEQLASVNSKIEKFEGMNIEEIQKQVETLKAQNSEFEIKSKADKEAFDKALADKDYEFSVKEIVGQHKFESEWAKEQFTNTLKSKGFKLEDGKLLGADDYIKDFSEKNKGIFVVEAPIDETPLPKFTTGNTDGQALKTKMSLNDWMKAKNANPNLELPDEF